MSKPISQGTTTQSSHVRPRRLLLVVDRYAGPTAQSLVEKLDLPPTDFDVLSLGRGFNPETSPFADIRSRDSLDDLLRDLDTLLGKAAMGLHLYIAGTESFVWQVSAVASRSGMRDDQIEREVVGARSRRVFCVHCRNLISDGDRPTVRCDRCGHLLVVRNHFSRRIGAYLGVCELRTENRETPLTGSSAP